MDVEIRHMEERLRTAMLTSDVPTLQALIDDRLLFVAPNGAVVRKADDLNLHRSGSLRFARLDLGEMLIEIYGKFAIVVVHAAIAGTMNGQGFEGKYRYVRAWMEHDGGWRVVGGSVSAAAD